MGTRNHAATREVLMVFAVALAGLAIVAVAMLGPYAWADRTGNSPTPAPTTVHPAIAHSAAAHTR